MEILFKQYSDWYTFSFSPYCSHCMAMKEEWENTATILKQEDSELWRGGKVDITCETELREEYNILGVPSIFL